MAGGQITSGGAAFDLGHLGPIEFACPCAEIGRPIRIRTVFGSHCYTKHFDPEAHSAKDICCYDAFPERPRVFCQIRYALSLRLPEIITSLPGRRVHQTNQARNYVYSVPISTERGVYNVFFMLQRDSTDGIDLRLTVESAYLVTGPAQFRKRPNAIRFSVLARKILQRQPVRFTSR